MSDIPFEPYYQDGAVTIYHGDCREVLPHLNCQADLYLVDPPYGMGKQKDGVANDNLYKDKLDAFLMECWRAARRCLKDNASAYIWGNAQDLWRLWYVGGLKDSERLTFRNEIAWDKREENPTMLVSGVPLKSRRMYHPTERCLFFMLGEQGFNNNADNYWEGWEPIRLYLEKEMQRCGWTVKDLNRITGTQMGGHWVTKSQWMLITAKHYESLQEAAAQHDAFKRQHDELKRAFYDTRAYFDNTHEAMTDVWDYPRVTGAERHGHATPKPVAMMQRIIRSSCPVGGLVLDTFMGTGPTLVAAKLEGRKAVGIELDERYCESAAKRLEQGVLF